MGTVLTIMLSVYYFIIFHKIKLLYFTFIFLIPFLPRYIGLGVGKEGFSLSLIRILLMILFIFFFVSFTQNSNYILNRTVLIYQKNKLLINMLLLFFLLKIISLLLNNGNSFPLYILLFNDFLFSIFIFFLTIIIIDSEESIEYLVKILFYSYTLVLFLVIIEYVVKYPLLSVFASDQMDLMKDVSKGFERNGGYRVSAGFDNPIPLGQYLVILFPLVISHINKNKYSLGVIILYSLLFLFSIYATGSRAAILMAVIMVYLYIMFKLYKINQTIRIIMNIANFLIAGFAVYFTYDFISNLISGFSGSYLVYSSSEERSSVARALQYIEIYAKSMESPLLGFGRLRNPGIDLQLGGIDNYYFIIILEVGIIGLFTYLTLNYLVIRTAFQQYKSVFTNYYLFSILISLILMVLYQILVSVPDVFTYLYIFIALVCIINTAKYSKGEIH